MAKGEQLTGQEINAFDNFIAKKSTDSLLRLISLVLEELQDRVVKDE